jgi:hypothetical protein
MHVRGLLLLLLAVVSSGCSRFFIARPQYNEVKKVAVVQYAINPRFIMGTPMADEAKTEVGAKNIEAFVKAMGNDWQIMPIAEMVANPAYQSWGVPSVDGVYTHKGMRFSADNRYDMVTAMIQPADAAKACEALGVDAVIALAESWNIQVNFFQGQTRNEYVVNMFDKTGARIWGDATVGQSDQNFGVPPGGAVATEMETWVKANSESFARALEDFRAHLAAPAK